MRDPKSWHVRLRRIDDDTVSVSADDSTGRFINVIVRRSEPSWWNGLPRYVRRELDNWWKRNEPQEVRP